MPNTIKAKLLIFCMGCCFLSCSEGKKEQKETADPNGQIEMEKVVKTEKTPEAQKENRGHDLDLNLSDPSQLGSFFQALQTNEATLANFEEKLKKGEFSEVELLQLKHHLSESLSEGDTVQKPTNNSGDEVKKAVQNLFKTVAKGTDQVLQRANPNTRKVEDLINERLALINPKAKASPLSP